MSQTDLRARILSLLRKHGEGLDVARIEAGLGAGRREHGKLLAAVEALEKARLVRRVKNRFVLPPAAGLVRGRFVSSRRGFGFVTPASGGEDIFVPARFASGVLQGDEVELLVKEKGRFGKPEGRIVRVLKKERTVLIGIYRERSGSPFLQAFDSPSPEDIPLRSGGRLAPEPGMIVEADRQSLSVSMVYGRPEDPGVDIRVIIRRYGLDAVFPDDALREAEAIPAGLSEDDLSGRRDLRDWTTVTIDGETAQDFDDAVSVGRLEGGGFLLGVHIADVSHYVKPGTALDREAAKRGTSVYFPGLTLPMLPEKLSNDLCSLRPAVPRLTVSVLMEIDARGRVGRTEFVPSVIRTAARMTYTSVFRIFQGDEGERSAYARLVPDFMLMRELAEVIREKRLAEGSLDFDLVEPELVYEEGRLQAVAAAERNEAHRLIEEFMVAANVAVASMFTDKKITAVYRVHPVPAASDLEKLRDFLAHFGYALPAAGKIRSRDLQAVLEKSRGRPEEKFVTVQVLRAMKLAVYSTENVGHYGLAKTDYTHFTSPIRRYPDLAVHRILKSALRRRKPGGADLEETALHSSERERNAAQAEQTLLEWRILRFLRERLGEEFAGTVVDVTKAGLIVELDDYFVDGLLPFPALRGEYDARRAGRALRRRKRRKSFELGDKVRVILVSCDPVLQRMSFMPSPDEEAGP
jgi:ribonuclease R